MQFPVPIKPTSNLMSPALQIAKDNPLYCALLLKILAFGKREIGLILRYGRLFVWHRYGAGNERLGLNTDEFVVVAEEDDSLVTRPIPTKGIPLDDSNASREAIRRTLSRFDAKSCCLAVIVRPDSYGVFKQVRDQAIALKFDYRLLPTEADSPIADRGGTGGKVQ